MRTRATLWRQSWDDFGGESSHLVEFVEEWVEQDRLCPGRGDLVQAGDAVVDGAGYRDRGEVAHPEVAVPAVEGVGDPVAGRAGVVVDGDVDPLGDGETAGVALLLVKLFTGDSGVLGECRGGGRSGADEAVRGSPLDWAEQQFRAMGRRDAHDLAVELVATYQGSALLSNTLGQPELMARQARRLERWIDELTPSTDTPAGGKG